MIRVTSRICLVSAREKIATIICFRERVSQAGPIYVTLILH